MARLPDRDKPLAVESATDGSALPRSPPPSSPPAATLRSRRASKRPWVRRVVLTVLVLCLAAGAGLVSGPLAALDVGSRRPDGYGDLAAAPSRGALLTARLWPTWAASPSGAFPVHRPRGSATDASVTSALSTGYRGWSPAPPPAVLAPSPQFAGKPSPLGDEARAIYLTGYTAGQPAALRYLIDLIESTALNALVVNIKDEQGKATYDTQVPAFREAGAISIQIHDMQEFLTLTRAYGIYTIARMVTFEDSTMTYHNPDLAVRRKDGSVWRDAAGNAWLDPFLPEAWDYVLSLAEEAAGLGFDEIQFDYVRFPTDGDVRNAVFSQPDGPDCVNRVRAITEFLNYARGRLAPYGTKTSADVFGIICSTSVDTALGQVLEDVAGAVDYLSPMIYPSHYGPRHFDLDEPDAQPYETIRGALSDALRRLGPEGKAKLRPWLQDFTMYHTYGPEQVLDQIRATHELGVKGWMLWNPSNRYTTAALYAYTVDLDAYLSGGQ